MKNPIIFLFFLMSALGLSAQTGAISGKVLDEVSAEEQTGAQVLIKGSNPVKVSVTGLTGDFQLRNVAPGTYTLVISYVSYVTKEITGVEVKPNEITTVNITLAEKVTEIEGEVVIEADFKKSSEAGFRMEQKNAVRVADGITAEAIRTSPVSNSGDVLKKVSGASVQGGKFAVIRGLNDRYNTAYINGAPLPSTEPDRRAFSFDIIPAGMLDRMVIYKTATPDMPGDFAGGIIQITTRDFPEINFYNLSLGTGYNTITTMKDFATYKGGKTDWLGIDDGTRKLPEGLTINPANNAIEKTPGNTNKFNNQYGSSFNSAAPNTSLQFSAGIVKRLKDDNSRLFATTFGITYSNSFRFSEVERQFRLPVSIDNQLLDSLQDKVYQSEILWGAIANFSFKINDFNRVSWKNLYNINSEDQTVKRERFDIQNEQVKRMESYYYIQNNILSSQLSGEHVVMKQKLKIDWVLGVNRITRQVPDYRTVQYIKRKEDHDSMFYTPIGLTPAPDYGGRFFSTLNENLYSGRLDVGYPLIDNKKALVFKKMDAKAGGAIQMRDRDFAARFLGWTTGMSQLDARLRLPVDKIFAPENTQSFSQGFQIDDRTNPSDKYDATSSLAAAYIMFDNRLGNRFRFIWGARYESFNQKLNSMNASNIPLHVDNTYNDLLPSGNLVYEVTSRANIRASFSKTVSRPEFRELAPFAFFDFNTFTTLQGYDSLKRATINNFDLRYEIFPDKGGEIISFSVFYKDFTNPIEGVVENSGSGSFISSFRNVPKATNYGAEFEFRKNLSFIRKSPLLYNTLLFGNFAYIISEVDLSKVATATSKNRPLQGQSNYIINAGIQMTDTGTDITGAVSVNRVGRRIAIVGTGSGGLFPDVWENPRTVIDLQISKKWGKKGNLETKLSVSDVLAQPLIYYMDRTQVVDENNQTATPDITGGNESGKFDGRSKDVLISRTTFGRIISIGVSYKF